MTTDAEKRAHGRRLVVAMAAKPISNQALADALGVDRKTIGNWRNGKTLPSAEDRITLERLLGPYNVDGDPVEVAIDSSTLHTWRRNAVKAEYHRHLHEQQREEAG